MRSTTRAQGHKGEKKPGTVNCDPVGQLQCLIIQRLLSYNFSNSGAMLTAGIQAVKTEPHKNHSRK